VRKLIDKMNAGVDANLAQDLAQISQTFAVVAYSAKKIAKSMIQLRRGNIPGAVKALTTGRRSTKWPSSVGDPHPSKALAENWLELQYGWKPLLADIDGVLKSLTAINSGDFVQRVTSSGKGRSYVEVKKSSVNDSGLTDAVRNITISDTQCKFGLRYRLASPLRSFLSQTGFTNPINLAWEILPFSFVVDWFLPIGPYLESFHAFEGLEFLDGYQTQFTRGKTVSTVDIEQPKTGNSTIFGVEHGQFEAEWVRLDRVKITSFPSLTFPQVKNGFASVTHAANAITLVVALFR